MKTVPSSKQSNPDVKQAVIDFQRPPTRQLKYGQYYTYKLYTTPTDATLPIYELSVPFFDEGTQEEWIKVWRKLQAVLKGQNVTQGPASYAVTKTLLKGDTLMALNRWKLIMAIKPCPTSNFV
eukprot:3560518-Ditylum_brightwellii.AAC.1